MENNNKLIIITGAYPPSVCGGADYIYKIKQTNNAKNWIIFHPQNWKFSTLQNKVKSINKLDINYINLQYPTMGYNGSFLPHLLCIYYSVFTKKVFSTTIHECSQLSLKAKLAEFVILLFSNKLIFTNNYELEYANRYIPFLKNKSQVIKIYTNIESKNQIKKIEDRYYDLIYFGLIRPAKGLEEYIETAKLLKLKDKNIKIAFAGKIQKEFNVYGTEILEKINNHADLIYLDKNENEVAELLQNCKIAYLPFPDGISERRGSALAVINSGGIIVTRKGIFTSKEFDLCCEYASNSKDAVDKIYSILKSDNITFNLKQNSNIDFLQTNFPKSWEDVAVKYTNFILK